MATLLKFPRIKKCCCTNYALLRANRFYSSIQDQNDAEGSNMEDKKSHDVKKISEIDSYADSIAARGFSRAAKSYDPPHNSKDVVKKIFSQVFSDKISSENLLTHSLTDSRKKFKFLVKCEKDFDHPISNSILHKLKTVSDVLEYFSTPVSCSTPYFDLAKQKDLPKNLSIQRNAFRFHPNTDTLFGGVSAFPESSTVVTGLRSKKMYEGFKYEKKWPFTMHKI